MEVKNDNSHELTPTENGQYKRVVVRILDLLATFLLEVVGGAGAVWGSSENAGIRTGVINDEWRGVCWVVFILCLIRWVAREAYGVTSHDGEVMAVFLLDVMGGAGAMWGCLEIAGYRVHYPKDCHDVQERDWGSFQGVGNAWGIQYSHCGNTIVNSRYICMVVFVLCAMSWQKLIPSGSSWCGKNAEFLLRTFLLEVMGGAGALWGFSEICGRAGHSLRLSWGDIYFGQESCDFWRILCLITFLLCLVRWLIIRVKRGPPPGWNGHKVDKPGLASTEFNEGGMTNTVELGDTQGNGL